MRSPLGPIKHRDKLAKFTRGWNSASKTKHNVVCYKHEREVGSEAEDEEGKVDTQLSHSLQPHSH